jgi:ferredoxin-thioredoxin reductase catalytic subunit
MTSKEEMQRRMQKKADEARFHLCPDKTLLDDLLDGLVKNEERYGYASCPCRISSGVKGNDVDIICPCEYREADVGEFGTCYCGLFVSKEVSEDASKLRSIPERRPVEIIDAANEAKLAKDSGQLKERPAQAPSAAKGKKRLPVWRCVVCGYLCARELPPPICPICKAKKDRFELFEFG